MRMHSGSYILVAPNTSFMQGTSMYEFNTLFIMMFRNKSNPISFAFTKKSLYSPQEPTGTIKLDVDATASVCQGCFAGRIENLV